MTYTGARGYHWGSHTYNWVFQNAIALGSKLVKKKNPQKEVGIVAYLSIGTGHKEKKGSAEKT